MSLSLRDCRNIDSPHHPSADKSAIVFELDPNPPKIADRIANVFFLRQTPLLSALVQVYLG